MSRRVLVVVEGQTELSVLNSIVAPHLGQLGVHLYAKVVGHPGHKGGVRSFESVAKEIVNLFKQEPTAVVSTFFDFYGLPGEWPGVSDAKQAKARGISTSHVASIAEQAWQGDVARRTATLGIHARFIPYVQMHELETLLFTSPKDMAEGFLQPNLEATFRAIVEECESCEDINDRPQSAPSKRIEALFSGYRKGRDRNKREGHRPHAPVIAARIGLVPIRAACPHFDSWVTALENLAARKEQ